MFLIIALILPYSTDKNLFFSQIARICSNIIQFQAINESDSESEPDTSPSHSEFINPDETRIVSDTQGSPLGRTENLSQENLKTTNLPTTRNDLQAPAPPHPATKEGEGRTWPRRVRKPVDRYKPFGWD